jgi:hypothetical protein
LTSWGGKGEVFEPYLTLRWARKELMVVPVMDLLKERWKL